MKKRLTFITLLMLFCSTIFGQSHWEMTQEEIDSYQDAQTLCLSVQINNVDIEEEGLEIAAFHNNTLRGVATTKYFKPKNTYYANIKVYGTTLSETISFRLYDTTGEEAKELSSDYTIDWNPDNTLGSPATPISVNFYEKHWEDNSGSFRFSMTIVCTIEIDNVIQQRSDLELAAFYGEELRGSTRVERMGETDFYVASLPVGGNTNNEIISFKLYDPTIDLELNTDYTVPFIADSQIGEEEPLTMRFFTPIAMINDQYFTSLAAAVEAATEDNNVITLLKEVTGDGVVIDKDVTIDFAGFAYTLNEGKVISIQEGGVATFVNDANITEGVELFGGQLYTTNDNLTIVAKKAFEHVTGEVGATAGWGTISTPVGKVAIPDNDNHDLYMYEEATAMWRFYTGGEAFDYFELGTGYLYANKSDVTIELEGKLNVNSLTLQLGYTEEMEALAGFNFVGNPFAHNIGETNFSTTDGSVLSNGFYVISAEGAIVARPENAVISPMESVMVQTDRETELTINNVPSSKRNAEDNGRLEISVANANYSDVAYVSFNEGRGLNKIAHRNAEIPMVYVPVDGINYAVATMNQDVTEIPVSFKAATIGEYTIGAETQNCEYAMMTLVDRFTGVETNLLIEDYTFIAKSNDSAERFFIRLDNGQQSTDNSHFAYINNGMMYIYNIEGQGVVNVYDVTGRPVAEYNVAESANISTSDFAAGVYIIRMSDENGVKVQKIVVE